MPLGIVLVVVQPMLPFFVMLVGVVLVVVVQQEVVVFVTSEHGNDISSTGKGLAVDGEYKEFDWVQNFNWDNLGQFWREGGDTMKAMAINPIAVVFGKIKAMSNCTIHYNKELKLELECVS